MIDKVINWVRLHHWIVISALCVLLMFKSCKVNFNERQIEYNKQKYEYVIDSMQTEIDNSNKDYEALLDTLHFVNCENMMLKELINETKQDKEYYRKQNRKLTDVAEVLSKKDTIK
jgi:septal ring factor EnvC (AmiA/AmiB activator)